MNTSDHERARILDAGKIVDTVERLRRRIAAQFPDSSLASVCGSLNDVARVTAMRAAGLAEPYRALRLLAIVVVAAGLAAQIYLAEIIDWSGILKRASPVEIAQGLNAMVNLLLLAFAGLWFVLTLEARWKRRRVFAYLYEFRSLAHIIDMHQLTKDPRVVLSADVQPAAASGRRMSAPELSRYLDYCTEMLALIAKLAALYAERTQDREVTDAVNEIEDLTSSLGRKIWQKITNLSQLQEICGVG
jgi:hypothetical protein